MVDVCWTSIRFIAEKNVLSFGIAVSLAVAIAAAVVTSTVASSLTARLQVLSHIARIVH